MLILQSLKLIFAISITLFFPGYFLVRAFDWKNKIPAFQKFILSFGLSIFATDFIFLLINRFGIPINFWSTFLSLLIFIIIAFLFNRKTKEEKLFFEKPDKKTMLVIFLVAFSAIIRLFFLSERLLPQSTDLGHHMYWSQYIVQFHSLPNYGMPDFIIGEHIIFAAISILSGISMVSSMPIAILFLVNIFSLLACFIAAYELARCFTGKNISSGIAIFTLLNIGLFYAVSSPQAKYVSGGVIGNTIGNFLIPLSFFLLAKFIRTRLPRYSVFFILIVATLAYTHHLSSFIFLYSFAGFLLVFSVLVASSYFIGKFRILTAETQVFIKTFLNWKTMLAFLIFMFFVFFVRIPSYLNPAAIDTAVGEPSKDTRTGLAMGTIIETAGSWRFFYGIIGIIVLLVILFTAFKRKFSDKKIFNLLISASLLLAWGIMIFAMSYIPKTLKVDIPSNRIGSYITYPFAFLSAIGVFYLFYLFREKADKTIFFVFTAVIIGTGIISGTAEISSSKKDETDNKSVYRTYAASEYLTKVALPNEQILKDHIYLLGDAWIKIFFMRDYKYPLSRSYLMRYDDPAKPRENCTRDMIAVPNSETGQNCFLQYNVRYVMLKRGHDTDQFENSENFSKIFVNDEVAVYERNE